MRSACQLVQEPTGLYSELKDDRWSEDRENVCGGRDGGKFGLRVSLILLRILSTIIMQ